MAAAPPWEAFAAWAIGRYGASLDVLELCNEPNLQGTSPETVAAMFVTAQRIASDLGSPLVLAGPATSDVRGYGHFTDRLLDALDARGFVAGPRFAWTHHNYADVAYATSRTADVRRRLVGRWAGWPAGDAGDPQILITEGGVTLRTIARRLGVADPAAQRARQGELVTAAFERLAGPEGAGVALVTQYLFHTDPRYDSGLCETAEEGGARRPAFEAWRAPALGGVDWVHGGDHAAARRGGGRHHRRGLSHHGRQPGRRRRDPDQGRRGRMDVGRAARARRRARRRARGAGPEARATPSPCCSATVPSSTWPTSR